MKEAKKEILILIILIILLIVNFAIIRYTGFTVITSLVRIGGVHIYIDNPVNITYNFSKGVNYTLGLNTSFSNGVITSWRYSLIDLKHNIVIYNNQSFTPNITFNAVRWSNKIIVYGIENTGYETNENVVFFIFVPNTAPVMDNLSSQYVCEGNSTSYIFNVTDVDEDSIVPSFVSAPAGNPFYIQLLSIYNATLSSHEIFSGTLSKADAGGINNGYKIYELNVSVNDNYNATCCSDSKTLNITVIEINNAPALTPIGVQTIWTKGENSTFYYQVIASDSENGNQNSNNLSFNISFSGSFLFNISSNGTMSFTASPGNVPVNKNSSVHNISVCVIDSGLLNISPNISLCGQTGGNRSACTNFSLTITNQNRNPNITSYYYSNLILNVSDTDNLKFNISKYDADGTIPDAYWYVDNALQEYDTGSSIDEFSYTFGCDVSGNHTVKVFITDGELNDSVQWNLSVSLIICSPPGPGSGAKGGGSSSTFICKEKWGCKEWLECKNLKNFYDSKKINFESFSMIKERCNFFKWKDDACGFQNKECFDVNNCNTNFTKPVIIKECFYTENPTCEDNILNCHNGSCEVLVDCGGPCKVCPSCSDKIKNQGEKEIDCGGPCSPCAPEVPIIQRRYFRILIFLLPFLIIIILLLLWRYLKLRESSKKKSKKKTRENLKIKQDKIKEE
jgi:hypothetical protein